MSAPRSTTKVQAVPRAGEWFETYTGRKFFPFDPSPDDVCLEDVAWALANICRFGGHCLRFYSVAQHSVWVSHHVPQELALQGLMHDAHEAYTGDMIRPIKIQLRKVAGMVYDCMEELVQGAITMKLGGAIVTAEAAAQVKLADNRALATERRDLRKPSGFQWETDGLEDPERIVEFWDRTYAGVQFVKRYRELAGDGP